MSNTLEKLQQELSRWPGVNHRVDNSSKHPKLWLSYDGKERFLPFSKTQVQTRGVLNKLSQLRRALREMGAERE